MATSFALYKLPNQTQLYYLESRAKESYNIEFIKELKSPHFVIAPFQVDSKTPVFALPAKDVQIFNEEALMEYDFPFEERKAFGVNETPRKEHISKASILRCKMENESYHKIVLSRVKKVKRGNKSLQQIYLDLTKNYPSAFVYLLQLPNGQLWCGATPETLAQYEEGHFKTMALAGTQTLNSQQIQEVQWQEKELDEQQWVQDDIEMRFKKNKISFSKSEPHTIQAGHLAHIKTDYAAKCSSKKATQILADLHPTPAVCGTPTEETKKEIVHVESHKRQYYAGYLGLFAPQNFELFVNLRCMLIDKGNFHLFVGGGLTKDSDPELEWEETEEKAQTLLNSLI